MDALFDLDESARSSFLQFLMQSTGCTYICLWSYSFLQRANCLIGLDGCYNDGANMIRPDALVLFLEYRQLIFPLENNHDLVPGFAFRNYSPYIELREPELQNRAYHQTQRQFYREAGIKTAVFMGCRSGEIELGSPNAVNINMEMEMRSFFPEDFLRRGQSPVAVGDQLPPQPTDLNRPSSSSLTSPSTGGSPESYRMFTSPSAPRPQVPTGELLAKPTTSSIYDPHQQAMQQALSELRSNIRLPTLESENAAITKAILAVLTSPSSSSSSTSHHNLPHQLNPNATAFKRYGSVFSAAPTIPAKASLPAQSMLKRAIQFYRKFNLVRREQLLRSRPTANQLQHMLSERKRREKLNESFDALRSLLPLGTKRDRVSVLTSTRENLASLKAQIMELNRQNQSLQAQLSTTSGGAAGEVNGSSNERLNIRIFPASESTSEQRIIELRINVRGEKPAVDILIRLLEFLKLDRNISLMSTEANTRITELGSVNHVNLRFRIEGNDWDEATFREAVRRILADLMQ
ncbi:hypothetical protein like AT5G56960 [Hibiscus trionum]|uniref:BHLH domain-containing protein n=1 Tax=Hibiscus trionum TaxID=183268 RepID=A0A9W7IB02_HIBTR|nr:hypothetical protein like AT5G56960 [Hibiscus trionum]